MNVCDEVHKSAASGPTRDPDQLLPFSPTISETISKDST